MMVSCISRGWLLRDQLVALFRAYRMAILVYTVARLLFQDFYFSDANVNLSHDQMAMTFTRLDAPT